MRKCLLASLAVGVIATSSFAQVAKQTPNHILPDGSAFLWIEGENALLTRTDGSDPDPTQTLMIVDKENPITGIETLFDVEVPGGGLDILPADTNASGGAALFDNLGGDGANRATFQLQFEIPATYYLYPRYSMFNRELNANYLNEDSIYIPPTFNADPRDGWLDYSGTNFNGEPEDGNSNRDGWIPLGKEIITKGDSLGTHDDAEEDFWNGQFYFDLWDVTVHMNEEDQWVDDFGLLVEYEVTEDMVGQVLDYTIARREPYGVIDGLLFATSNQLLEIDGFTQEELTALVTVDPGPNVEGDFNGNGERDPGDLDLLAAAMQNNDAAFDLDGDGDADLDDRTKWVQELTNTFYGDADFNGEFNSSDFVAVFGAAKYETDQPSTWAEGDWNGDGFFNSSDFVTAFGGAGYENGPRDGGLQVVPEPNAVALALLGAGFLFARRRI